MTRRLSAWPGTYLACALAACSTGAPGAAAGPPSRDEARQALKQLWDSVNTFEFRCIECRLDKQGLPDRSQPLLKYEVAHSSGGRWSFRSMSAGPVGPFFEWHTDDGRRNYRVQPFEFDRKTIDKIFIRNQANRDDAYDGTMCPPLWLLLPGGKPLVAYLDAGGRIEWSTDAAGKRVATLIAKHKGNGLRCELDVERDWLPRRIEIENVAVMQATKFALKDGRWFPVEGTQRSLFATKDPTLGFFVEDVRINQPIPASRFTPLPAPAGCIIQDLTTGNSTIEGGLEARRRLEAELPQPAESTSASPIIASRDPEPFPWPLLLGGASVALVGVATLVVYRRRRERTV